MRTLSAHGITVALPWGWEGSIGCRPAAEGETTHPVLHAGSFPLPAHRGDFGSGAVDRMHSGDAFIVLLEYHGDSLGSALFARAGMPRSLAPQDFSTTLLQHPVPGQAGAQAFFHEAGRPFCLFVVLGGFRNRARVVPEVNRVLSSVKIGQA